MLDPTVTLSQEDIVVQCNRLAQENKLEAVEIIAEAMDGIRNICVEDLYEIIVKIHSEYLLIIIATYYNLFAVRYRGCKVEFACRRLKIISDK